MRLWVSRAAKQWLTFTVLISALLAFWHVPVVAFVDLEHGPRVLLFGIFEEFLILFKRSPSRLWAIDLSRGVSGKVVTHLRHL